MPDMGHPHDQHSGDTRPPRNWSDALAALPQETPDGDGWARLAARLPINSDATIAPAGDAARIKPSPRRRRPLIWLATAAVLATAAAIPLQLLRQAPHGDAMPVAVAPATTDPGVSTHEQLALDQLYAESARLEALVAMARDDSMASAPATLLTASLDDRIGAIDSTLTQAGLDNEQRVQLWQSRVETLRELAGVETTQRWLSAHGERWDAALVRVD